MEGKALLFKIFAGIDVFDIEIDAKNQKTFIEAVKSIDCPEERYKYESKLSDQQNKSNFENRLDKISE